MQDAFVRSVSGVGDHKRTLILWSCEDGIFFQAGCFFGSNDDFMAAVIEKYGKNSQYERAMNFLISEI
jgi:hypothetical protein